MGDGSVSLILDVAGLAQRSHLFQKSNRRGFVAETSHPVISPKMNQEVEDFLFFRLNSKESYCLPLCLVHRLEEFPEADVQCSGLQRMVKYRGSILPLVSLNEFFGLKPDQTLANSGDSTGMPISLIVVQRKSRFFGIQVNEVVDILSVSGSIEDAVKETRGILGSLIIEKEVATVIDIFAVLDTLSGVPPKAVSIAKPQSAHILFAEDTVFFMKQVKKLLEKQGYVVTHAEDGEQAWQILSASKPGDYQLVLSDIEMPKMTGFELAQKVRGDARFATTPLIALTTKCREVDREKGREVGFTRYLEKLRSDELLDALQDILGGHAHV